MEESRDGEHTFSVILFDLGNVLVRVDYAAFLRTLGFDHKMSEKELYRLLEVDSRAYETGKVSPQEYHAALNRKLGTTYTFEQFTKAWISILPEAVPEMPELAERLAPEYRLMILSNTNELHFRHMMELLPVLHRFERFFLSFKIGYLKPDPAIYNYVLSQVDVPANRLLFIDDLEANIEAAKNAGMSGIVFRGADSLQQDLQRLNVLQ